MFERMNIHIREKIERWITLLETNILNSLEKSYMAVIFSLNKLFINTPEYLNTKLLCEDLNYQTLNIWTSISFKTEMMHINLKYITFQNIYLSKSLHNAFYATRHHMSYSYNKRINCSFVVPDAFKAQEKTRKSKYLWIFHQLTMKGFYWMGSYKVGFIDPKDIWSSQDITVKQL